MTYALPAVNIHQESSLWKDEEPEPQALRALQAAVDALQRDFSAYEVSVVFADDPFVHSLNKTYRGKDKPTNVLSFPSDDEDFVGEGDLTPLGDIILAYETLHNEAQSQETFFEDHVAHLIVHGFLHLLGYDHENEKDAREMEALEISILKTLDIPNPYGEGGS